MRKKRKLSFTYLDSESDTLLPPELDSTLAVLERDLLLLSLLLLRSSPLNSFKREVAGGLKTGNSSSPFEPCWEALELFRLPNNQRPVLPPLVFRLFDLFRDGCDMPRAMASASATVRVRDWLSRSGREVRRRWTTGLSWDERLKLRWRLWYLWMWVCEGIRMKVWGYEELCTCIS